LRGSTIWDGEEKKLFRALMILRKRRHQKRAKERDQKWSNFAHKAKKKKKERKRADLFLLHSSTQETHKERERESTRVRERKKR